MKFLIDRCAGRRLADWLRTEGHDVAEARERGPDPGDAALLEWAAQEGRVLVTIDADFGRLIRAHQAVHAGLIRLPDTPAARRIELMRQLLADHSVDELVASVITIRGTRIRITRSQ